MASFTSLGVGSNLPLDTLLNNLTIAEKKRLNPITQQQSDNTARLTAYGTLKIKKCIRKIPDCKYCVK